VKIQSKYRENDGYKVIVSDERGPEERVLYEILVFTDVSRTEVTLRYRPPPVWNRPRLLLENIPGALLPFILQAVSEAQGSNSAKLPSLFREEALLGVPGSGGSFRETVEEFVQGGRLGAYQATVAEVVGVNVNGDPQTFDRSLTVYPGDTGWTEHNYRCAVMNSQGYSLTDSEIGIRENWHSVHQPSVITDTILQVVQYIRPAQ
jgi:hypothetical protein